VKICVMAVLVAAAGCASPEKAITGPETSGRHDMSGNGVGGNGGDDLSRGGGGGEDLSMPSQGGGDLSNASVPDLALGHDMTPPMCTVNPPVAGAPCQEFPQCGCAGTQNCDLDRSSATSGMTLCVAAGATALYGICDPSVYGNCPKGASCIGGACKPFCANAATDCPGSYRNCGSVVDSNNAAIPGAKICSQFCDPVNPQSSAGGHGACGAGVNCIPDSSAAHASDCVGFVGTGTQGSSCFVNGIADCAVGYNCVPSTSACAKSCNMGSNADCTSVGNKTCTSFSPKQYAGAQEVGYCK
jgi:hypothetical protein